MPAEIQSLAEQALPGDVPGQTKLLALRPWLGQPALYESVWQDRFTGRVFTLRPPLPLASTKEWVAYRDELVQPLLDRNPVAERLLIQNQLVLEVLTWRLAQPLDCRHWRSEVERNAVTEPLEWYYDAMPSLAVQVEDSPRYGRFWSLVHPRFSPPSIDGVWWTEFHSMSSNERWAQRREDLAERARTDWPDDYWFKRYLGDIDYLLSWRRLIPAADRPWRTLAKEREMRQSRLTPQIVS